MDFQDKQKECFQENYDELCDIIFSVKDKSLLKDFLNCLFTPRGLILHKDGLS